MSWRPQEKKFNVELSANELHAVIAGLRYLILHERFEVSLIVAPLMSRLLKDWDTLSGEERAEASKK